MFTSHQSPSPMAWERHRIISQGWSPIESRRIGINIGYYIYLNRHRLSVQLKNDWDNIRVGQRTAGWPLDEISSSSFTGKHSSSLD